MALGDQWVSSRWGRRAIFSGGATGSHGRVDRARRGRDAERRGRDAGEHAYHWGAHAASGRGTLGDGGSGEGYRGVGGGTRQPWAPVFPT